MIQFTGFLCMLCLLGAEIGRSEMVPEGFFPNFKELPSLQKEELLIQLQSLDIKSLEKQRASIFEKPAFLGPLSSFEKYYKRGSFEDRALGKKLLSEGKVGCLIVAGGQGSRLNYTKPKGFYPITFIKQKSLFQLFAERILAAGKWVGVPLKVAIMTSLSNHEETIQSFQENDFFGLDPDQVFFFSQDELPLLNAKGDLFLETETKFATGPDGNASSLKHFVSSGIWKAWKKAGICYVNYMHVDNALADPFDPELSGFHEKFDSDVIVKCIFRENPLEKLGVLFEKEGKVLVVEYSEISEEERDAKNKDGSLKNICANIGLYSFKMDFIYEIASHYADLPFHKAWKSAKALTSDGTFQMSEKPIAWKFEKFIFDVLPFAKDVRALLYSREECFAPLKNGEGDDSAEFVRKALQRLDQKVFEQITGNPIPNSALFELDPAFYYPTKDLLENWKGKSLPKDAYVNPS